MFDPNADPIPVAARAAELALEQNERLRRWQNRHPEKSVGEFYSNVFEASICQQIANLLCGYAVLKGYVTYEEATR